MKWILTLTICLMLLKIIRNRIYIWISEPTNGKKVIWRVTILFISQRMDKIGGLFRAKLRGPEIIKSFQKKLGQLFGRGIQSMGRHGFIILDGLMFTIFQTYTLNKCRVGMRFGTWCIVNLVCYVTLFWYYIILIVDKYIIHLGRKTISWIWGVGDVAVTSGFYYHIQENCLFLTRKKYCSL